MCPGPGRAGKLGELITEKGAGRYEGEVLAGRPHGYGKYFALKANKQWELEYEGEWVQGMRQVSLGSQQDGKGIPCHTAGYFLTLTPCSHPLFLACGLGERG